MILSSRLIPYTRITLASLAAHRQFHSTLTRRNAPAVSLTKEGLRVTVPSTSTDRVFPYTWLRDSDPQLIDPYTRQKLHSSVDIPQDVVPLDARVSQDGTSIEIKWSEGNQQSAPWPTSSTFAIDFLNLQGNPREVRTFHHDIQPVFWTRSMLAESPDLFMNYSTVLNSDDGLLRAASQLTSYGILFVKDVPNEETDDATAEVPRLAQRFGRIRETWYGRTWDVQSRGAASKNIAYTDLDLGLHIDLQYFEQPPRYQILHMLRNRGVSGGASIFSDAFHAAYTLKDADRTAFDTLSSEPVAFHYMNDDHHLYREHPTIQLAPRGSHYYDYSAQGLKSEGEPVIQYINYSPPFQAPLPLSTAHNPAFLPALKKFAGYLASPTALFEHRMEEGVAVIFDNRRVLHGRREFSNASKTEWDGVQVGEGVRWIKGCYIEAEGILDRMNTLKDRQSSKE